MTTQRDRVAESSTDTGTGTLVLGGAAIGYRTFSAAFGAGGNTEVYYGIVQDLTGEWETGLGTYLGPSNALRRDLVLASSNGGALTVFPIGDKMVYTTFPAETTLTLRSRRTTDRTLSLEGNEPSLYISETDVTDPNGRFRLISQSGVLSVQRAKTALWATSQTIWSATSTTFGIGSSTDNLGITAWGTFVVASTAPQLRLEESDQTDPAGRYRFQVSTDVFAFQRALTAAWASTVPIWSYAHATPLLTLTPDTAIAGVAKLGTTSGVAEVGSASNAQLKFMRGGACQIVVPTSGSLRIIYETSTIWATITSTAGWAAGASDLRLKDNVIPIRYGLDTILALRPVEFDWIPEEGGRHDIGLVAQEVERIIPEIVEVWLADPEVEGQKDTYAMRKDALVAVLIRGMQQQQQMIEALGERLRALERAA